MMQKLFFLLVTIGLVSLAFIIQPHRFLSAQNSTEMYDLFPSGDQSGQTDTTALNELIQAKGGNVRIAVAPGEYYFTKQGNNGLIDLRSQLGEYVHGITIDGQDMNHTTFYITGVEPNASADWYLFFLKETKKFTLKNVTIDGSKLETQAEQIHGINAVQAVDLTLENVRGQFIKGDTAKLIYDCNNCKFLNTEHISNGRSGISMRDDASEPNELTYGGVTVDGFYARDISDQAIDMEPGFEPGELILTNGRIYGESNNGICFSIVGNGDNKNRFIIDNWQVYCRTYLFNAGQIIVSNSIFDSSRTTGSALRIQKASHEVIVSDSIITSGVSGDGAIHLTVHNGGRPDRVLLSNLIINVKNQPNSGSGINLYDTSNVSIQNVDIRNENRLESGLIYRDVSSGVDRGHLSITGLKVRNANHGIRISSTSPEPTVIDTAVLQGNHFRDTTYGIKIENATSTKSVSYIRDLVIASNSFGENVANKIFVGSFLQSSNQ